MILEILLGSVLLFVFLLWYYQDRAIGSAKLPKKNVTPMRGGYPIIGDLRTTLLVTDRSNELLALEFEKNNDKPFSVSLPFQPAFIVINDAPTVEHILNTQFDNYIKGPIFYRNFRQVFGSGIFNCDGAQWYKQRKISAKLFTARTFRTSFETVFLSNITAFTNRLDDSIGSEVDMHDLLHRFFLDSFSKIAFGIDLNSISGKDLPFVKSFDVTQKAISDRFFNPFWQLTELFQPNISTSMKYIRDFGREVVQDRRKSKEKREDLLNLFMDYKNEDGSQLSDEELVDQVINFIVAGRDTTAQTLSWALFCLHNNPRVVEKLLEEAERVMGSASIPTYDQVRELKYANHVFMETLRLYPPVSRNTKVALKDDVLPNGVEIKKGTMIILSAYSLGRSKNIWKDPYEFKPERWAESKAPSPYEFLAFNAGPRLCLGRTMAELQGVFVLISLVKNYDIKVVDVNSVVSPRSLTLPMKNGLKCTINKRAKSAH